jgi:hypothetical protein
VSNSSAVHSKSSVKRKSKKFRDNEPSLKVRTPKDSPLAFLRDAGIIVPEEIPSDDDSVPLDFTRLSNRGIGQLQSRYAVRHAHAIFNAAKLSADVAQLKRDLRLEKAKFRLRNKGEKVNVINSMMEEDDTIVEIEDALTAVEMKVDLIGAVAAGYEDLRNAASREMTRRLGERAAVD